MIVMKFGGSSVESAVAIERVAGIVRERIERKPVVVVSAMGKTTNRLLAIANAAAAGELDSALVQLAELRTYTLREGADLASLQAIFAELDIDVHLIAELGEFPPHLVDAVSACGERLSSIVVTHVFRELGIDAVHVDSREVIITDTRHTAAAPLFARTYPQLAEVVTPLAEKQVVVMGGFIGSTQEGVTTTLGRGGSDYTASIVGAGIGAEEIQIWTDVDGMLTCDPTILKGGHRVKTMSFAEAAELAYFGAKVLHPATVLPAIEKNIPVLILNSRSPSPKGTRIIKDTVPCRNILKSIACKRNITVVKIQSLRMLMAHGFLRRIFEVFDRFQTPVDMIATSEVSVSATIDDCRHLEHVREELGRIADVEIEHERAIICLVGDNIRGTPGIGARIFRALDTINVLMVSHGASQLNFSFVIAQSDLQAAVKALHDEFFRNPDPAVFE